MMMMSTHDHDQSCVLGAAIALFLVFAFLIRLLGKKMVRGLMENQVDHEKGGSRNDEMEDLWAKEMGAVSRDSDVIIVGAGVAGSALAYALAKDGRRVHVIERDLQEPDRFVGEGLQPGGYVKLVELGLEDCVTDIDAQHLLGYVFHKKGRYAKLLYPSSNSVSNNIVTGICFRNGRFVQKLRNKAASLPNVLLEQGTVTSLIKEQGIVKGVRYKTSNGRETRAYASLTIVCDGYFSNLRRSLCDAKMDLTCYLVGWIVENCQLPYPNYAHLMLGDLSPALIYPVSSTETRCFISIPGKKLPSISNGDLCHHIKTNVVPQMEPELRSAIMDTVDKAKLKAIPYYQMATTQYWTPGAFLLGDAFNTRHPLTAGGMTVALSDVVVIRDLLMPLADLGDAFAVRKQLQSFYTKREPLAFIMNTLAAVLDGVFCNVKNQSMKDMQDLYLDCFRKGGSFVIFLMNHVSGLNVTPLSILLFVCSLISSLVGLVLLPFPSPKRILIGTRLMWNLASTFISTAGTTRVNINKDSLLRVD